MYGESVVFSFLVSIAVNGFNDCKAVEAYPSRRRANHMDFVISSSAMHVTFARIDRAREDIIKLCTMKLLNLVETLQVLN